jgi:DNA-binding CsgD family transcriptional regulator
MRGGLCANTTAETEAFQRLLSGSMLPASEAGATAGGAMRLSRRSMKQPLQVVVCRLRGSARHRMDVAAKAIVFLHDPEIDQEISCERLVTLHCLTQAEARIGAMLASGGSVETISEQLNVSSHTVRTHIKHLLAKTDARNQAQLVRLLIRSLASLSDASEL